MPNPKNVIKVIKKLFKRINKKIDVDPTKKRNYGNPGIDPKTGYRKGYKPHYLSGPEAKLLGAVGIGGPTVITALTLHNKKREEKRKKEIEKLKNLNVKSQGGAVGPNRIL